MEVYVMFVMYVVVFIFFNMSVVTLYLSNLLNYVHTQALCLNHKNKKTDLLNPL